MPLKTAEIARKLRQLFIDTDIVESPQRDSCFIEIPSSHYLAIAQALHDDPELAFDYLEFQTCSDRPPDFLDFIAAFYSYQHGHRVILKTALDRYNPALPTLSKLWANADWNEREVYDLFGVFFSAHPDLRRIMMPEDWEGHPLRKDYVHPNLVKRPD